jgi:UDP-N-acetylglucosamine 3-dehydrogenase
MKPRVGVIGYGAIGRHHARNLASMDGVVFQGVAEIGEAARAEAQSHGHRTFDTPEALLEAGVDAVVICVPTMYHEQVALSFIAASVAVLVEKPIADSVKAGERIIAAARAANVPLMVGYVERHNPAVIAAKKFIAEGNLGSLISISAQRVGILPPRIKDANVLVDIGVHDIDAVAFITEQPLQLVAVQGGRAVLNDRVDYAMLSLTAGQTAASVITNWITPVKRRKLAITGLRGHVEIDYMTQEAFFAPAHDYLPTLSYEGLVAEYKGSEMIPLPVQKAEPLRLELQAFIAGIQNSDLPDPAIALESLRIAEEATERVDALHQLLTKV